MKRQSLSTILLVVVSMFTVQLTPGGPLHQSPAQSSPVVGLVDETQELYPDTKLDPPVKHLEAHTPRNTVTAVHVMITGLRGTENIAFSESDENGKPTAGTQWYR